MTHRLTRNNQLALDVAEQLERNGLTLVLAESCTAGLVAAQMAGVPRISRFLCGSLVTYQAEAKVAWLGIERSLIDTHTAVSSEVTRAMADAALTKMQHAQLAGAITGHLGPGAPESLDGVCFVATAVRAAAAPHLQLERRVQLKASDRVDRQHEAVATLLSLLYETLRDHMSVD